MKRYLIFAALGPFIGGFLLLLTSTLISGYWSLPPSVSEVGRLFEVFAKTLQYSYLFGLLPMLMIAAVDDIVCHIERISPVVRMLIVGAIAFGAAEFLYSSRGPDSGVTQFILYGLVGFIPTAISSWLAHKAAQSREPAAASE